MADESAADTSKTGDLVPTASTPAGETAETKTSFLDIVKSTSSWGADKEAAGATQRAPAAGKSDKWFGYAAQGALVVAIVGFGWAVGGHVYFGRQASDHAAADAAVRAKAEADQNDLRKATTSMASDIRALKTSLDALKTAGARTPTQDEIRLLERNVDALKGKLDVAKTETNAALVQLGNKVERAQAEPAGKLHEMSERLERIEKQTSAPLTTASIPTPAVTVVPTPLPMPRAKSANDAAPSVAPTTEADAKKPPQLIAGWVVREVYDGIALLEGPRGPYEAMVGATIPGAGTVKSIQRRGAGWIVVTTRGLVDYARN